MRNLFLPLVEHHLQEGRQGVEVVDVVGGGVAGAGEDSQAVFLGAR